MAREGCCERGRYSLLMESYSCPVHDALDAAYARAENEFEAERRRCLEIVQYWHQEWVKHNVTHLPFDQILRDLASGSSLSEVKKLGWRPISISQTE
jgi:hypothetical protein